jgi:hypothetical protein
VSEFSGATDQSADDAEELLDRDGGKIARAALQTGLQCDEGTTGGNGSWNSRQATQGQYRGRE